MLKALKDYWKFKEKERRIVNNLNIANKDRGFLSTECLKVAKRLQIG